jgi:dienelactone hydrolase
MGWIELKAADGHGLQAWCARPPGEVRGGIVVLQEIFGVNAHIRSVCDRWAGEGWLATLAWLAASRLRGVDAAVAYYGTSIAGYLGETPKAPVLLHFGEQDTHIPPQDVQQIMRSFPAIPMHLYPAGHGFNCDARPSFHGESAALAAERTRAFLDASLKTPEAP